MQGGKDASSPRYINTKLANLTRHIFNKADDCLLDYLNEEGLDIEPVWCASASRPAHAACRCTLMHRPLQRSPCRI